MPRVSVVTPTYNRAHHLTQTINSVLYQTYRDLEVIVVDDGSTDETRDVVQQFANCRIKYIYQENQERSVARNTGIKTSEGEYIAFLDSDDLWLPNKLEVQVPILDRQDRVGLVYSDIQLIMPGGHFVSHHPYPFYQGNVTKYLILRNFVPSPTPLIRRECLAQVGFFDSAMVPSEDRDLWLRISRAYEFAYVDQVLSRYKVHPYYSERDIQRIASGYFKVLSKFFQNPDLPREVRILRNRAFANAHFCVAELCHSYDQMPKARMHLWKSVHLYPYAPERLFLLLRGHLGTWFMAKAYRWKKHFYKIWSRVAKQQRCSP